jgi:hypothetical protein
MEQRLACGRWSAKGTVPRGDPAAELRGDCGARHRHEQEGLQARSTAGSCLIVREVPAEGTCLAELWAERGPSRRPFKWLCK